MSAVTVVGKYAYCPSHVNFFKNKNQYFSRGGKTPRAGDIIFFTTSGSSACHVGIVEKVSGSKVYTIEGNTSGASTLVSNGGGVCRKSYALTSTYILGYGRPAYASGEAAKMVAIAQGEVGYLEKKSKSQLDSKTANAGSNNYTKYGAWYGINAQPWCDIFVSWCAYMVDQGVPTTATTTKEEFEVARTWKNGSTSEPVYADTTKKTKIGSLNAYESCDCLGKAGSMYIVRYKVDGSSAYKVGLVSYSGGLT